MSHSVALRQQDVAESPPQIANCRQGGFDWRCLPTAQSLIDAGEHDWLGLRERPGTTRVKRNGHRDVWRIDLPGESIFVKRYRSESLAERAKALLRGPTAALEWDVGHYAARHGIDAVLPIACGWKGSRIWSGLLCS